PAAATTAAAGYGIARAKTAVAAIAAGPTDNHPAIDDVGIRNLGGCATAAAATATRAGTTGAIRTVLSCARSQTISVGILSNDAGCAARPGTLAESSVPASATGRIGAAAAACTSGIYPGKRAPAVATWIAIGTAGA